MTIYQTYRDFLQKLQAIYGLHEADAITRIIFEHISGLTRTDLLRDPERICGLSEKTDLEIALNRLLQQEPVQYITGDCWFYNRIFRVNKDVLIPRPETEELVTLAVKLLQQKKGKSVLEIGSGSGCISISIKLEQTDAEISSMDISDAALSTAKLNATTLGAEVNWMKGDFLESGIWQSMNNYDLIVSNPPYIPESELQNMQKNVTAHEPAIALFVPDEDPLVFYRAIAEFGLHHLNTNGHMLVECHRDYAKKCLELYQTYGYDGEVINDIYGNNRFVLVSRSR